MMSSTSELPTFESHLSFLLLFLFAFLCFRLQVCVINQHKTVNKRAPESTTLRDSPRGGCGDERSFVYLSTLNAYFMAPQHHKSFFIDKLCVVERVSHTAVELFPFGDSDRWKCLICIKKARFNPPTTRANFSFLPAEDFYVFT
jgi:hypothetical protein